MGRQLKTIHYSGVASIIYLPNVFKWESPLCLEVATEMTLD